MKILMRIKKPWILCMAIILPLVVSAHADFSGWVTEIYGNGGLTGSPADWMELYCSAAGDVAGARVYHQYTGTGTLAKVMPALTVGKGDFIVIHFSDGTTPDETDITGDTNGNGYWDLYAAHENNSSWGISLSKGACWVTGSDGTTWKDYMAFFDPSGTWDTDIEVSYASATLRSEWSPLQQGSWGSSDYQDNIVDSSDRYSGISLQRNCSASGDPEDSDTKDDWEMATTSEGDGYFVPVAIAGKLEVSDSPFFPRGDNSGKPILGRVTYKLASADYNLTIAVYDIEGNIRKYLLHDYALASAQGGVTWDGTDEYGDLVPVGIYIVSLKAHNRSTGDIQKEQAGIIVGRKF